MIYQYTLFPIEYFLRITFTFLQYVSNSWFLSLILLALLVHLITKPLALFARKISLYESEISAILAPQIKNINKCMSGVDAHAALGRLYARYNYHPAYTIRTLFPILVQLPFFIAAYYMLNNYEGLKGIVVIGIGDLSKPDAILFGRINLLPILMTFINLLTIYTTPRITIKNMVQGLCVSLLFFVLLYTSPAALLIYWTTNNFIIFIINLISFKDAYQKRLKHDFYRLKVIFSKIVWRDVFLLCAFFSFFFTFQEFLFCLSTTGKIGLNEDQSLFVFASLASIFSVIAILSKFPGKTSLLSCGAVSLAVGAFLLPTLFEETYLAIPYLNTIMVIFTLTLLPILYIFLPNKGDFNSNRHFGLTLLASLGGCAFHWSNNTDYFSFKTTLFFFSFAILGALIFCIFSIPYLIKLKNNRNMWILSPCLILCFLFLPSIHEIFIIKIYFLEYFIMFVLLGSVSLFFSYKKIKYFYVLLLAFSGICLLSGLTSFYYSNIAKKKISLENDNKISFIEGHGTITSTPNIYYIIAESTTDLQTLEQLGVSTVKLKKLLAKYGYKIYNETYTHGSASLSSVSKTLNMQSVITGATKDGYRKLVGGDNLVNHWLKKLGYRTVSCLNGYMTGGYNTYDESFNHKIRENAEKDFLVTMLRGLGMREFKFDIGFEDRKFYNKKNGSYISYEEYFKEVVERNKTSPYFTIYHGKIPSHSQNSGKCRENETEIYNSRFDKSVEMLTEKLNLIEKYDPFSIVIIAGDHGPYLTGDCFFLKGYKDKDITELMVRDRIGTLLAIHWPEPIKAMKYDENLFVNQNIFPTIFAYLYDNQSILSLKVPSTARFNKGGAIKNGVFLPINNIPKSYENRETDIQ